MYENKQKEDAAPQINKADIYDMLYWHGDTFVTDKRLTTLTCNDKYISSLEDITIDMEYAIRSDVDDDSKHNFIQQREELIKNKKEENYQILSNIKNTIEFSKTLELTEDYKMFIQIFLRLRRIYTKHNLKSATFVQKEFVLKMHDLLKTNRPLINNTIGYLSESGIRSRIRNSFYYMYWLDNKGVRHNMDHELYCNHIISIYNAYMLLKYCANKFDKKLNNKYLTHIQDILGVFYASDVMVPQSVIVELRDIHSDLVCKEMDIIKLSNVLVIH